MEASRQTSEVYNIFLPISFHMIGSRLAVFGVPLPK
jgi:hypothetical protein